MGRQIGAGIPGLSTKVLLALPIPLPPLSVQAEIVRILDSFTSLTAELEAELEARRAQYAHYRDELLKFTNRGGGGKIVNRPLGQIAGSERPGKYPVPSTHASATFAPPVLTAGATPLPPDRPDTADIHTHPVPHGADSPHFHSGGQLVG